MLVLRYNAISLGVEDLSDNSEGDIKTITLVWYIP